MKTFVTIFPDAHDVHLIKDVGQIPYLMHSLYGYDSTLLTYANEKDYRHLQDAVRGLKISFIAKGAYLRWFDTAIIWYLIRHGGEIDVLNLYHDTLATKLYAWVFKAVNPRGFLYVKLDGNAKDLADQVARSRQRGAIRTWLLDAVQSKFAKCANCISIETRNAYNYYLQCHPEFVDKLILMPNGIDHDYALSKITPLVFDQKENLIITVGRLGDPIKNTELLVKAIALLPTVGDWKVCLVGPRSGEFDAWLRGFLASHPKLGDAIVLGGEVRSRSELYQWYSRAKVFVLSSNREGFPLVFPEALFFGNVIISTDVSGADDITDNGRIGQVVPVNDAPALASALLRAISDDNYLSATSNAAADYCREHFVWSTILSKLKNSIDGSNA